MTQDDKLVILDAYSEITLMISEVSDILLHMQAKHDAVTERDDERVASVLARLSRRAWRNRFYLRLRIGEFDNSFVQAVQQLAVSPDADTLQMLERAYARVASECPTHDWAMQLRALISTAMDETRRSQQTA